MFDDRNADDMPMKEEHGEGQAQGDGRHHHEIQEDEGGGYHSKHTHPDGREEHDDHVSYEDARDKMDADFGQGRDDQEGESDGGDMSPDDIAGSYGRAHHQE